MLTDKEKEELSNLRVGFNKILESEDHNILTNRRIEISRVWSKKLLRLSFFFNIVTILCFVIATLFIFVKPEPSFYVTTPSGKIFGPLSKIIPPQK